MSSNFALIGLAGYIAPRHLKAIRQTGNQLIAAVDPHDSVGIIDRYFPDARFFTEIERFDRHLEKLRRKNDETRVRYVSICTPNYLHDAHARLALRIGAHAICEKPLVINPWNLDALEELEHEYGTSVYTILQLRHHPSLIALKQRLAGEAHREKADVVLTYVTRRGAWYKSSWKYDESKSGGVAMNIGIHFFDLLSWLFGPMKRSEVHVRQPDTMAGMLELEWARVRWFLSIDGSNLPSDAQEKEMVAFRSLTMNGEEIEFSGGFTDLHTRVYEDILSGGGFRIPETRPSINMVYDIRHAEVTLPASKNAHPIVGTV